jgi:hypothetical protein
MLVEELCPLPAPTPPVEVAVPDVLVLVLVLVEVLVEVEVDVLVDVPGMHCEYQGLLYVQTLPDTQVVAPVQPWPPH